MARLLSVNVGLPRDIEWKGRTVHTGIWKDPVGEDVFFVSAKAGWFDKDMHPFIEDFLKQAKKRKIKYFHIFHAEGEDVCA